MKRMRDYQIRIGTLPPGPKNSITDVAGVRVGHVTLAEGTARTGLTVILPSEDSVFQNKMLCGSTVFNGYGKSAGLIQIEEMGTLETPIVLTNTFGVGDACSGLIAHLIEQDPAIGLQAGTVNPVVLECNDGYLNDLRGLHVKPVHVAQAIRSASTNVVEGSVGAGTGMSAYQLKGGIGTASRKVGIFSTAYTVGGLVLTNMGRLSDLVIDGRPVGRTLAESMPNHAPVTDKGSIIMIVGTDAPLSSRQLKRLSRRCIVGLSRTGSHMGQGSGEIALCFSTVNRVPHQSRMLLQMEFLPDDQLDPLFDGVIEVVEESILNAMVAADDMTGANEHHRASLAGLIEPLLR